MWHQRYKILNAQLPWNQQAREMRRILLKNFSGTCFFGTADELFENASHLCCPLGPCQTSGYSNGQKYLTNVDTRLGVYGGQRKLTV